MLQNLYLLVNDLCLYFLLYKIKTNISTNCKEKHEPEQLKKMLHLRIQAPKEIQV